MDEVNFKNVPISTTISIILILIFSLQTKNVDCTNTIQTTFYNNFVHTQSYHLVANLCALFVLSKVEQKIGKDFFPLIVFLLTINTIFQYIARKIFPNLISCSIGFSGILFGIMTYEIITEQGLDANILLSISLIVVYPSFSQKNISFSGHLIGAISGIIGALIWKNFREKNINL